MNLQDPHELERYHIEEILFDECVDADKSGLYFLFWMDELIYIGISVNIYNRLKSHFREMKKWMPHICPMSDDLKIWGYCEENKRTGGRKYTSVKVFNHASIMPIDANKMRSLESEYIYHYSPRWNLQS